MLKKPNIIFYSIILYRCMCQIQDRLSMPRLSTSSKKDMPGRVQINRNPFDRLLPFSPFPLGRAFWDSHNCPSQVRIISTLSPFRNCPQHYNVTDSKSICDYSTHQYLAAFLLAENSNFATNSKCLFFIQQGKLIEKDCHLNMY